MYKTVSEIFEKGEERAKLESKGTDESEWMNRNWLLTRLPGTAWCFDLWWRFWPSPSMNPATVSWQRLFGAGACNFGLLLNVKSCLRYEVKALKAFSWTLFPSLQLLHSSMAATLLQVRELPSKLGCWR